MPTSRQLRVLVCAVLCFGPAAWSTAHPHEEFAENAPGPSTRRDTQQPRIKYASGAERSRAGWTLGHEEESSTMRALFKVHLRQCNIDRLEEEALAVSELDSPRYGQHLSAAEVCRMSSCPGRAEGVRGVLEWVLDAAEALPEGFRWEEGKWLTPEEGRDDVMVKVLCSHVVVSMSAAAAADTFPEAAFRPHRRTRAHTRTPGGDGSPLTGSTSGGGGGGKEKTNAAILRATGDVLVPLTLAPHVEFVSGLTELWVPDARHGKVDRAGTGRFGGLSGGNQLTSQTSDFTEVLVQPRTLRALYGVPDGERGGWAGQGDNRQGVAAFDDFYLPADMCAAHNLLALDSDWLSPPDVTDHGSSADALGGEAGSDVDTQYMTLMGPGVPVTFSNYAAGEWVLDWAGEASEGDLTPEMGGPLVWSISHSAPEAWVCYVQDDLCDETAGPHGYDPTLYLNAANVALMKLASLGVSVLVSSGDNGSGMAATCPIDPRMPVDVFGGEVEGATNACPFEKRDDCNCASFEMVLQTPTNASRCILPLGMVAANVEVEAPGAECLEVFESPDCVTLLTKIENGTLPSAHQLVNEEASRTAGVSDVGLASKSEDATCRFDFLASNLSFYSTCKCKNVPPMTEGTCSLSGFTFQPKKDGYTPFTPGFPASSPWVTSVGATQIGWDLGGSCMQSDLLGPGNAQSAETAVNKFTGGFESGGGFSTFFPAQDYQVSHTKGYVGTRAAPPAGTFNSSNRGFPDVSAAGHNFVVVVDGKVEQVSGTSASAPTLAGMISLMNERLLADGKPPLGFLNPALYKAAEESPSSFQKILPRTYNFTGTPFEAALGPSFQVGSNKCSKYSCCEFGYGGSEAGSWDPVTGLGTINYQDLSEYLKIPPSPHHAKPGRGHDRHRTAYVTWIVVLVLGLVGATLLLVYEHRPRLMLSAATLGRSMKNMGGGGGGDDEFSAYGRGAGNDGGWGGVAGGSWRGGDAGTRSRGALTEMVMESEIGTVAGDAAYRLLEEDGGEYDEYGGHRELEGQREEEEGQQGRSERSARRSV